MQASFANISLDQGVQVRLVNGELSGAQRYNFRIVVVGAGDLMANFREASSRYQPDVSTTNHRNSQDSGLLVRTKTLYELQTRYSMPSLGAGSKL
jgi:hypothetical protein